MSSRDNTEATAEGAANRASSRKASGDGRRAEAGAAEDSGVVTCRPVELEAAIVPGAGDDPEGECPGGGRSYE